VSNAPSPSSSAHWRKFSAPTVKALAVKSDVVFVVGSKSSSNSNRLRELAELLGTRAY
jgi:4-hydroxy-3-methylbut-2-enyl diphosphate reductase